MSRLQADADPARWVAVTGSLGFRGRRHRKAAIRMLMEQANAALGASARPASGIAAWAVSQAAPLLMRKADGRVLVWVWKDDPELLVAMAQLQQATPQLRASRAMMPMEYDDTESFRNPYLGVGEKLAMTLPSGDKTPPFLSYTWDTGTHFVTLTAVCSDRTRVGTVVGDVDHLARSLRVVGDVTLGSSPDVLRLDPS
ncbi:hypothetical protein QNO21_14535 [Microbacterium sp. zg-Y818]|uniref:hypothetical protein n=1 Tax=unclassified Microbacterium TaxID=2609290 RepID=UPI00214BAE5D|nr:MULTISPECIES: hypothetical protein [unclassified Microbacterium]MCR2800346.1 hypothetical protein [Microbacterium sp. zg.Y818]WIM22306.1 hypothetical protein QNO21_14535 [Microbacterium sp. zg-Y818]